MLGSKKRKILFLSLVGFTVLGLLIATISFFSKNFKFLDQPVVKMPVPELPLLLNQANLKVARQEETDSAKYGKSNKKFTGKPSDSKSAKETTRTLSVPSVGTVITQGSTNSQIIRINLGGNQQSYEVAASTELLILNSENQVLSKLKPSQKFRITAQNEGIQIGDKVYSGSVVVKPEGNGLLFLSGNWYRGSFALVKSANFLVLVNYIQLEEYLLSVVGCEMSASAPDEALKAQAVAARSYAASFVNTSQVFDLGNDEKYQVYKGVRCESDRVSQSVIDTSGTILVVSGKVLRAMFAANDEIIRTKQGGAQSMSQAGAIEKAKAGQNFGQILELYYPGSTLGKL